MKRDVGWISGRTEQYVKIEIHAVSFLNPSRCICGSRCTFTSSLHEFPPRRGLNSFLYSFAFSLSYRRGWEDEEKANEYKKA